MRILLLLSVLCPLVCFAQAQDAVYFIDMQKVLDGSIAGKAARSDLEAEARKRQMTLEASRVELEKLKVDFEKQKALLSSGALAERQQTIERKERELGRAFDDQREEIARINDTQMKKVVAEIDQTVKDLITQNNYRLVVERDNRLVMYADPKWDLTETVVKKLNEKKLAN
jgi:outer membrane protein